MLELPLALFRAGHLPVTGGWLALPLLWLASSVRPGDAPCAEILYPAAHRLLAHCEAVRRALARGLPVYYRLEEVPGYVAA